MKRDIQRFAAQERGRDVFFTSMIDLYAIPHDFPGFGDAEKLRNDPYNRVDCLQDAWRDDIGDPRFVPFIQLHEYEAYLFCGVHEFLVFYEGAEKEVAELHTIAVKCRSPELIDDGQHTSPSKRIIGVFPDYAGAKVTIGPLIAKRIGLQAIRERCPHFDDWLTKIERLGAMTA